jgi:hypothetical protein
VGVFYSAFLSSEFDPDQINLIIPIKGTFEAIMRRHGRVNNLVIMTFSRWLTEGTHIEAEILSSRAKKAHTIY